MKAPARSMAKTRQCFTALVQLLLLFVSGTFSQSSPENQTARVSSKTVLLIKNNSYLENAVGKIVVDSLIHKGFSVKTISQQDLNNENPGVYQIVIVFSGVKSSELTAPIKKFMNYTSGKNANVLISTVYGEAWGKNKPTVDAVATATKTLNPEMIAAKIVTSINRFIEKDLILDGKDTVK